MYISIDNTIVSKNLNEIKGKLDDFDNHNNELLNTVNDIYNIWQGNDYNNFENEMKEFTNQLLRLSQSIESYRNFVKGYVLTDEKIESHYSNKRITLE